jgi:hypothetical protein
VSYDEDHRYTRSKVVERVDLTLFTDDVEQVALCQDYWATDTEGDFVHTVKTLGARYDIVPNAYRRPLAHAPRHALHRFNAKRVAWAWSFVAARVFSTCTGGRAEMIRMPALPIGA